MGKQYKLYTNSASTAAGTTSVKIVKKGTIRCIWADIGVLGGAGVSRMNYEVSKQNTGSLTVNDTPDTVLASFSIDSPNAVHNAVNCGIACAIDVEVGDTIYINATLTGAVAPASATVNIYLYT